MGLFFLKDSVYKPNKRQAFKRSYRIFGYYQCEHKSNKIISNAEETEMMKRAQFTNTQNVIDNTLCDGSQINLILRYAITLENETHTSADQYYHKSTNTLY